MVGRKYLLCFWSLAMLWRDACRREPEDPAKREGAGAVRKAGRQRAAA